MSKENQSQIFIRLLAEEFQSDRMDKRLGLTRRSKAQAKKLRQLSKFGAKFARDSAEPMDCVRMMSAEFR